MRSYTLKHVHTEFSLSSPSLFSFCPLPPPPTTPPPVLYSASLSSPCSSSTSSSSTTSSTSTSSSFSLSPNVTRSSFFLFFGAFYPSHRTCLRPPPLCCYRVPLVYCLPSPSLFFYPEKGWLLERKRVASGRVAGVSRTGRRISRRPREREAPVPNRGWTRRAVGAANGAQSAPG